MDGWHVCKQSVLNAIEGEGGGRSGEKHLVGPQIGAFTDFAHLGQMPLLRSNACDVYIDPPRSEES